MTVDDNRGGRGSGRLDQGNRSRYERFLKPLIDRILGLLLGIVALPIGIAVAVIVWIDMGRPVLFKQRRVGLYGRVFDVYKFRTMQPDRRCSSVSAYSGRDRRVDHKSHSDPRITTLGRFLRKWSLDELPQLWNVIKGDMSLVGPRPELEQIVATYEDWQHQRHLVKPGLTGLWQVEARGDGRQMHRNTFYDIQYVDSVSLATDLQILAKTLPAVVTRREQLNGTEPDNGETAHEGRQPPRWVVAARASLMLIDVALWAAALMVAVANQTDFGWGRLNVGGLLALMAGAAVMQLAWGLLAGLYVGRWRLASFEEMGWFLVGNIVTGATLLFVNSLPSGPNLVPRGVILAAPAYQLIGAMAVRYVVRSIWQTSKISKHIRPHRLIVFGAGEAGADAVRALIEDSRTDLHPVAFLDDDPAKAHLRLRGVPVLGTRQEIAPVAKRYGADTLLIAVPSADAATIGDIADRAQAAGLAVRILPRLSKFITEPVESSDIRRITFADFLQRQEVHLDLDRIADYLTGKVVLVTGAGGSIGSQLCEEIRRYRPDRLLMLDRNENALHDLQLRLFGRAMSTSPDLILADIRDRDSVFRIMREQQPDVVFHAAALKHVPFLESHPQEAIKTNVFGTLNLLDAALDVGVGRFVNISTDKAADPINVLGQTKRIAEMLTAFAGLQGATDCISVRFGNVLGSAGSVIPTFREQLAKGEPLTVTDPEVTRYFMTIEEAVQLVVQAGSIGQNGDVLVLDMGRPVKIVDLARRLAAEVTPGRAPQIEFTGLRPGEKLDEVLASDADAYIDRPHPALMRYAVPGIAPWYLTELAGDDPGVLRARLAEAVTQRIGSIDLR